ncbi:hypothetical protein B0H13DRAFT_2563807 [Mycena leptocephala]|nr:hypothetical protein B0H13DRAFT_2563807 [Mycena leptocephala]
MAAFSGTGPTLPRELEKIIFEMAAMKHPLSMPSMVRVAQRVKIWIEPQLYKVLMIDIAPGRSTYAQCIVIRSLRAVQKLIASSSRRAPMLRKHVRHVILSYYCPKDVALKLLSLCNSTVNLVITAGRGREILPLLASLPLTRLGLGAWWIDNVLHGTFTDPAFADITHLHIHGPDAWSYPSWSIFVCSPQLTHLSFAENCVRESTCRSALQRCPLLKVLVWLLRDRYRYTPFRYDTSQSLSHITDSRFVQLKVPDHWAEWERGARGFDDYWVEAETIVAERRANIA